MTAPIPIASGNRLSPARLNDPGWTTMAGTIWAATTTNPTVGNGVVSCRWRYVDSEQVAVRYIIRPGSTTTFGSGTYQLQLPVPAVAGGPLPLLHGLVTVPQIYHLIGWANTTSAAVATLTILRGNPTASENLASWTPTAPFTFASGHSFAMYGTYFYA
jgi:hypothetical protein